MITIIIIIANMGKYSLLWGTFLCISLSQQDKKNETFPYYNIVQKGRNTQSWKALVFFYSDYSNVYNLTQNRSQNPFIYSNVRNN